ncbi:MAG TPA: hypothetical protein VGA90_07585 [Methylomirabilota bacterium]
MITIFRRLCGLNIALLAAGALAACAQLPSSQQPVQASNPSVTATLTSNADFSKTAVFECVRTAVPAPAPVNPNLSYTYRTDQELVQASQTASAYWLRYGSQPMSSSMMANSDGTRTATFQCGAR